MSKIDLCPEIIYPLALCRTNDIMLLYIKEGVIIMNSARLTVRLPPAELNFAKNYAKEQGISLTALILRYFERLKQAESKDIPTEILPIAGIIPENTSVKREYAAYIESKHK